MDVLKATPTRRAVRSYSDLPVPDAVLRNLVDAALHPTSATKAQPWIFAVVQDRARLKRWSDRAKALLLEVVNADPKTVHYDTLLTDPSFCIFYDASSLVVIGAPAPGTHSDADGWVAAENLMLAATHAGLATCPIGLAIGVLNTPEVKAELGFPPRAVAIAPIVVGYRRAPVPTVARAEPRITAWLR